MKTTFALMAALVAGLLLSAPAAAATGDSTVTIENQSSWEIHQMFFSPVDEEEWGADQLREEIITSGGGTFTLNGIPCDDYDIKLVDEDGDECVVGGVSICAGQGQWVISDDDLLECQAETE